jgi:hypothetical protein
MNIFSRYKESTIMAITIVGSTKKALSLDDDELEEEAQSALGDVEAAAISDAKELAGEVGADAATNATKSIIAPIIIPAAETIATDIITGNKAGATKAAKKAAAMTVAAVKPALEVEGTKVTAEIKPKLYAVYNIVYSDFINDAKGFTVELPKAIKNEAHAIESELKAIIGKFTGRKVVGISHLEISNTTHISAEK